jgi:hypothetical protein
MFRTDFAGQIQKFILGATALVLLLEIGTKANFSAV